MTDPFTFPSDLLTADERRVLAAIADRIWQARTTIAAEWSTMLMAATPEYFADGRVSVEQLGAVNERFLMATADYMRRDDLGGLTRAYYDMNRRLLDADLQQTEGRRISLVSLYTSARLGLRAIEAHLHGLAPHDARAFGKLGTHLLMLVSLAYSESRQEALQRARPHLGRCERRPGHTGVFRAANRAAGFRDGRGAADKVTLTPPSPFVIG